jgi:protein TonB
MDKNFKPPKPREMFAPEPLMVRIRAWRPRGLQLGLIVSFVFHLVVVPAGALIWTWIYGPIDFARVFQDTPLEVILVNARTNEKPTKPQAIAQANLAGGGEAEAGIATSPLPPSPSEAFGDDQSDAAKAIQQMQEMQQQILTQIRREVAAMPLPDPRTGAVTQAEREQEEKRQQRLRFLAEIEKRINSENARPRRRYLSPSTREEVYAVYSDRLRTRIEQRGTTDFPTMNGHKLYGDLMVNLTINSKGQVIEAEVVQRSKSRALDQRALAIARAAGPFGDFSDDMRRSTDELVLTWHFRFTADDGMKATMAPRRE